MHFDIQYRPAHSLAIAHLGPGESVRAEASAMVSMTRNLATTTDGPMGGRGGLLKSFKRAVLGGETFFTNTFTAQSTPGHVALGAGIEYEVTKASRGWIASYLSGEGLVLRMSGRGRIYLQSRNPSEYGKAVGSQLPPRRG